MVDRCEARAEAYLRRALRLAARGRYRTSPNPMVGALVVRDAEVVGAGYHREVGGPHAEVEALAEASERARGSDLYVTMEPCAHHGRTPPCVEAVVAAGVRRVVACHRDPDPRVAGRGFSRLRRAGVEVEVGALGAEAVPLNWRYLTVKVRGRPAVTLKWAMSLDGKIALSDGQSRWISSPRGRRWALELREEHDAVLVGSGTALADDPRLDRRLKKAPGRVLRVVLDRRLRLGPGARMFDVEGAVLVYTESRNRERRKELESRGGEVVILPQVTPPSVLQDLLGRGVHSVLVEGGGEVHSAFVEAGCFDRVAVSCAPVLIGGRSAPTPVGGGGAGSLRLAPRLDRLRVQRRGPDVVLWGFREGCLPELEARVGLA